MKIPASLLTATILTLTLAACSNAGTGGGSSSSESVSSAMAVSSVIVSSAMSSSSTTSFQQSAMSSASAMMQSSASSETLAADNATAILAVQNFYLGALHQSDPVASGFVASSRYLTETARTSLQAGGVTAIYCTNQKPSTFSLVAIGASTTQRNVIVTESFHSTPTVKLTVSTVHQADGWKIDSVTCETSSSAMSQ